MWLFHGGLRCRSSTSQTTGRREPTRSSRRRCAVGCRCSRSLPSCSSPLSAAPSPGGSTRTRRGQTSRTRARRRSWLRPSSTPSSAGRSGHSTRCPRRPSSSTGTRPGCVEYFLRVTKRNGQLFTGGLAWIDAQGKVRASSTVTSPGPVTDVSDRAYFREAVRTGKAFVSAGLTSRRTHRHVLVIAVPTRDAAGTTTGVLAGTLAREAHQARPEDDRPRLQRARHPRPRESARLLGLHAPAEPRVDQAIRQGAVRHPVRRARAERRLGPRGRVRAIERAPVERHPRPLALRDLRGRATQPRHRARADRGGDADRSRPAGLDPHTRPRRGPRRWASALATAASATRRSTASP